MRQHTFREMKQFSIVLKATRGLFRFCFTSLCDWSRKLAPLNQTISATIHDSFGRVFPRFTRFACFYFELSLALQSIFRSSYWLFSFLWFWFHDTYRNNTL